MDFDEIRFRHIGLSTDGAVIFCEMDHGSTYAMPLDALEVAEDWDPRARPTAMRIIHDNYAVVVTFDNGVEIDFPNDFVFHVCEPAYPYYKGNAGAAKQRGKRARGRTKKGKLTITSS